MDTTRRAGFTCATSPAARCRPESRHLVADVRDLWTKRLAASVRGACRSNVAPHGVTLVRITPTGFDGPDGSPP